MKSFNFTFINAQKINSRLKIFPMKTWELWFVLSLSVGMEITCLSARVSQNDGARRTYRMRTLAFGRKCMPKFDKWGRWLQCWRAVENKPLKYEYFPSGYLVPFTHRHICTRIHIQGRLYVLRVFYVYIWATACMIFMFSERGLYLSNIREIPVI